MSNRLYSLSFTGTQSADVGNVILPFTIVVFITAALTKWGEHYVPTGILSVTIGLEVGFVFGILIVNNLSRDAHLTLLGLLSGIPISGLVNHLDLETAANSVEKSVLALSGILTPICASTINALGVGTPSPEYVGYGVIAGEVILLLVLGLTLKNNPPDSGSVIKNIDRFPEEDRIKIRHALGG